MKDKMYLIVGVQGRQSFVIKMQRKKVGGVLRRIVFKWEEVFMEEVVLGLLWGVIGDVIMNQSDVQRSLLYERIE